MLKLLESWTDVYNSIEFSQSQDDRHEPQVPHVAHAGLKLKEPSSPDLPASVSPSFPSARITGVRHGIRRPTFILKTIYNKGEQLGHRHSLGYIYSPDI